MFGQARCLTKSDDMVEDFVDRVVSRLNDRSHGVLITVVQLMTRVLVMDGENTENHGENDEGNSLCHTAFCGWSPPLSNCCGIY